MDRERSAALLHREIVRYAQRSYADLSSQIGQIDAYPVEGADDVTYQVEISAIWDREPGGTIRVLGAIDDGGFLSSFSPVTDDFLMGPDGSVDITEPPA